MRKEIARQTVSVLLGIVLISGAARGQGLIERKSLGPDECTTFTFDVNKKGFRYDVYVSGFESDECKPSQFRVSKLFMKDSCHERDSDGDANDDEIFPSWCWSKNRKGVGGGEEGCIDAYYGASPSTFASLPQMLGGRDHWVDGGNMCYLKSTIGYIYVKSNCAGRAAITIKLESNDYEGGKWCLGGAAVLGEGWLAFIVLAVLLGLALICILLCLCLPCCPLQCSWKFVRKGKERKETRFMVHQYPRHMNDSISSRIFSRSFCNPHGHPLAGQCPGDHDCCRGHSFSGPHSAPLYPTPGPPHPPPPPRHNSPRFNRHVDDNEINMEDFSPLHRHKNKMRGYY